MRHQLLAYCEEITRHGQDVVAQAPTPVPENERIDGFDSLFEQRVYNRLVGRGYSVIPQLEQQGYLIDLVVVGASARLAIECDGDAWHGPEAYQRDLGRQRELERCGWVFRRIRESEFYVDGYKSMKVVWDALSELGITPYAPQLEPDETAEPEILKHSRPISVALPTQPRVENTLHSDPIPAPPSSQVNDAGDDNTNSDSGSLEAIEESTLAPYVRFHGRVPSVVEATQSEIIQGLVSIVSIEGPVLGERLRSLYVIHSGGRRVGRATATVLNQALGRALANGTLTGDNPLREPGYSQTEFRLPDQPQISVRTMGDRHLEQIPASELAALVRETAGRAPTASRTELYRLVLVRLGRKALTSTAEARFDRVIDSLLGEYQSIIGAGTAAEHSYVMDQGDAVDAVLQFVDRRGRIARSDVVNVTGLEPPRATSLLTEMVDRGQLERRGQRRGAHYVLPSGAESNSPQAGDGDI